MKNRAVKLQNMSVSDLVCRSCGKDELAVGVEGEAVDLGCVGVHCVTGLAGVIATSIPAERKQVNFRSGVNNSNQDQLIQPVFGSENARQ